MAHYLTPRTTQEALDALGRGGFSIVAGGTDFYPARVGRAVTESILDVSALSELRGIGEEDGQYRIGALTTWSDVARADLPPHFDGLKLAAREVGGLQIQNTGTVAGNICNASPAADGTVPLLAMDARVELRSLEGSREVDLASFVTGNRQTLLRPGEMVTAVLVPKPSHPARSTFIKLGARRYLVISIVSVAVVLELDAGRVAAARIAVGACSPVPVRLMALEAHLTGQPLAPGLGEAETTGLGEAVTPDHLAPLSPIDDVRATAAYRREAAHTLLRRALDGLAGQG